MGESGEVLEPEYVDPWERQPRESEEAYEAFATYRDQGDDRSIRAVAARLGKSGSLISGWSSTHGWVGRIRAYNVHLDRIRQRVYMQELESMFHRQAKQSIAVQQLGLEGVEHYLHLWELEKAKTVDDPSYIPAHPLNPDQILKYIEIGMRMERLARGEPDSIEQVTLSDDGRDSQYRLVIQDPEVKDAYRELVRRAGAARTRESRRLGPGDEPEVPPSPSH